VQAGLTWEGIKWAFTTTHAYNWHPVTWLSHMADAQLFGPGPIGPHVMNVLFHAANTVLLFIGLKRLTARSGGARWWGLVLRCSPARGVRAGFPNGRHSLSAFFFLPRC